MSYHKDFRDLEDPRLDEYAEEPEEDDDTDEGSELLKDEEDYEDVIDDVYCASIARDYGNFLNTLYGG